MQGEVSTCTTGAMATTEACQSSLEKGIGLDNRPNAEDLANRLVSGWIHQNLVEAGEVDWLF